MKKTSINYQRFYLWCKKGIALALFSLCLMLASGSAVQAASTTGSASYSRTFTIKTNSKISRRLTFTQTKGTAKGNYSLSGKHTTYKLYGRYDIRLKYTYKGKSYNKKYTWTGKSKSFSLSKNTTYTITVTPHSNLTLHTSYKALIKGFGFYGWSVTPTWTATGNSGVTFPSSTSSMIPSIKISSGSTGYKTLTLSASTTPSGRGVSWKSSNTNVATVASNGTVTAHGTGSCTITATMNYNGKNYSASKTITVGGGTSYGSWSSWSFNYPNVGSGYQVESAKLYSYYYFLCPVCGGREPFQGMSDCHRYSLTLKNAWSEWFPVPYSASNPKRYSYTNRKYYTTSLGDGKIWNFSAGNLYHTAVGTKDAESDATVIRTGFRYRRIYTNNCYIKSVS